MAAGPILIVYSTAMHTPRRWIVPGPDILDALAFLNALPVDPGESKLISVVADTAAVTYTQVVGLIAAHADVAVSAVSSGRCAIVDPDQGIVGTIHADPSADSIPGMTLVAIAS